MKSLVYPLAAANGRLVLTSDYPTIVKQVIRATIQTYWEERVMRPDFGVPNFVFESQPNLAPVLGDIRAALDNSLSTDLPDVSYQVLGAIGDTGQLQVTIAYQVADLDPDSLEVDIAG